MHTSNVCANCLTKTKCRRREFSEQAWSVLVLWEEIEEQTVDKPICDSCYTELRETLIDRQAEVEKAVTQPQTTKKAASSHSKKKAKGKKVRLAS